MIIAKINSTHLERKALVYVRQSTYAQIMQNQESTELQYNLSRRAIELGWSESKVVIIDEDQGHTGKTAEHRNGFQYLVSEVSLNRVGVVLMREASRLARNNSDWYHLIEICGITRTLLADSSAVYDPRDPNDRLLLGVKGTISEAELFTLRTRLYEGRWNKAKKGLLIFSLPTGYVRASDGNWELDPDVQVRERLSYIFQAFQRYGVVRSVVSDLRQQRLQIPARMTDREGYGSLVWKTPTLSAISRILSNPGYAGTYVYGRWSYSDEKRSQKTGKASCKLLTPEQWAVCIHNHHVPYISWEEYIRNREQMRQNWYRENSRGAAREGAALLQGIVYCGICGRKMSVQNRAAVEKRSPSYMCGLGYQDGDRSICQSMTARPVDVAIVAAFMEALTPLQLAVSMKVLDQIEQNVAAQRRQWELQLEQARYEARLAQRKYDSSDPENRLVTAELERRWNEKLERVSQLEQDYAKAAKQSQWNINEEERAAISKLSQDLPAIWQAETTTNKERKQLLRYAIEMVQLDGKSQPGKIEVEIRWRSGTVTMISVNRATPGEGSLKTPESAVKLIHKLAPKYSYTEIAEKLNAKGLRAAFGRPFNAYNVGYLCRRDGLGKGKSRAVVEH